MEDCLESISEQEFQDYETILVVDGNEDDPSEVIEKYKESAKIKLFRLEGKHGVSAARNLGLEKATGEFVYFLDGDDYLDGDTIGKLVKLMTPEDDVAYGDIMYTWFQKKLSTKSKKVKMKITTAKIRNRYILTMIFSNTDITCTTD